MVEKFIKKITDNPFLIELGQGHYIKLVMDKTGRIVWGVNPVNNPVFINTVNYLLGKNIMDFFDIDPALLSTGSRKLPDLKALDNYYRGKDPNQVVTFINMGNSFYSRNVFEYTVEQYDMVTSVPLSSIWLLRIVPGYCLGIISFSAYFERLPRYPNDVNLIVDERNRLIGFDRKSLHEFSHNPPRLGRPLSDYIDTGFQTEIPAVGLKLKAGRALFEFAAGQGKDLDYNFPALFKDTREGLHCSTEDTRYPAFMRLPLETDFQRHDYSIEFTAGAVAGAPPLCILNASGLQEGIFPDAGGQMLSPSAVHLSRRAALKGGMVFTLKSKTVTVAVYDHAVVPKARQYHYKILGTHDRLSFHVNNVFLGTLPLNEAESVPGCRYIVIGLRPGCACRFERIKVSEHPKTRSGQRASRKITRVKGRPEKIFRVFSHYVQSFDGRGSWIFNYLRLEDLGIREKLRKVTIEKQEREAEIRKLKRCIFEPGGFNRLTGESPAVQKIRETLKTAAGSDIPVLLTGETGTGKSLMAGIIHEESARRDGPFVKVDCSAIPESLIESELFGFEKGAFTGAVHAFQGKFEQAHRGTLFIDEIGNLNASVQTKLLTVLEDFVFYRIGGKEPIKADVRIITATNADLEDLIRRGKFRKDLFYRLNVLALNVPPLRDRIEDIPLLCESLFNGPFQKHAMRPEKISPGVYGVFMRYPWPGNIRELQNLLLKSLLFCKGRTLLAKDIVFPEEASPADKSRTPHVFQKKYNRRVPAEEIRSALNDCRGNVTMAADRLGIARITIYRKLAKTGLTRPR